MQWVLDADISRFFDTISHDWLVRFIEHRIGDRRIVRLIQKWLKVGVLEDGARIASEEGTPQGGPLSPLLSNILLDDLDKELERRGHAFCRYADDCAPRRREEEAVM